MERKFNDYYNTKVSFSYKCIFSIFFVKMICFGTVKIAFIIRLNHTRPARPLRYYASTENRCEMDGLEIIVFRTLRVSLQLIITDHFLIFLSIYSFSFAVSLFSPASVSVLPFIFVISTTARSTTLELQTSIGDIHHLLLDRLPT